MAKDPNTVLYGPTPSEQILITKWRVLVTFLMTSGPLVVPYETIEAQNEAVAIAAIPKVVSDLTHWYNNPQVTNKIIFLPELMTNQYTMIGRDLCCGFTATVVKL